MSKHFDKIEPIKYVFDKGSVSTIDNELSIFWSDRKFERYPHLSDDSHGLQLEQTTKKPEMVEYKINYKWYGSHVEDLSLLRSIIRIKELSDGNPELSLEIWRKKVRRITQEDEFLIRELVELEQITKTEFNAFFKHLTDSEYRLAQEEDSLTNKVIETDGEVASQHEISKSYDPHRGSIRKMLKLIACREYYRKIQRGDIFSWTDSPFGYSGRLRVETADKIAQKYGMEIKDKWEEKDYDSEDFAQKLLEAYPDLEDQWEEYKKQDY